MTVSQRVFRKAALDRASSPEQLDLLMQVTSPLGWLALLAMAFLIGLAILWSVVGRVPELVDAPGVLMRGERLTDVQSPMAGVLERLDARPGDVIEPGVIGVIKQELAGREERQADALAIARTEQLLVAKRAELQTALRQRALQQDAARQGLVPKNAVYEYDRRVNVVQGEVNGLERELQILRARKETTAEITVPTGGRVVQVLKSPGDRIREGEPLLRLEAVTADRESAACGGQVHAALYVPGTLASRVRAGDPARVSPADVKREEHGFIVGRVEWIASYAAATDDMREKLKNDQLVQAFAAVGPVYEARVCLEKDPTNSRNGFRWSSGQGPAQQVSPGAPCSASLVVDERAPYTYVVPALRRATGL